MKKELFFATPIYVKDVGSQEFNSRLEQNIINWSNKDKGIISLQKNQGLFFKKLNNEFVDFSFLGASFGGASGII